jgi:hypothetical protein
MCSNFGLTTSGGMEGSCEWEACQFFLVLSRSSNTPLYPSKCCELGSGPKFQPLPHCRILGPSSGSTRNLGARHRVLKYNGCWIGLCRCEQMTNEIIGFGHSILLFLFTLSELTFKCVIRFELHLEKIKDWWKW